MKDKKGTKIMKKLKKIVCTVLALMFVLSLATTALAVDVPLEDGSGTKDIPITADATKGADVVNHVYMVTIDWTLSEDLTNVIAMDSDTYDWNTSYLRWDKTPGALTKTGGVYNVTVTVTNSSSQRINATGTVNENALLDEPENNSVIVETASNGYNNTEASSAPAPNTILTFTVNTESNEFKAAMDDFIGTNGTLTLGTISIAIAPAPAA